MPGCISFEYACICSPQFRWVFTLLTTNSLPDHENRPKPETKLLFQSSIFTCELLMVQISSEHQLRLAVALPLVIKAFLHPKWFGISETLYIMGYLSYQLAQNVWTIKGILVSGRFWCLYCLVTARPRLEPRWTNWKLISIIANILQIPTKTDTLLQIPKEIDHDLIMALQIQDIFLSFPFIT